MSMRVQIPAYTDRWMMGDRYGTVVKTTKGRVQNVKAKQPGPYEKFDVAHVRLDISGRTIRVLLDDCTIV